MKKKDIIIVVVFLAIGFGGGTFLFRAIKGNDKEKTEKTDDKVKVEKDSDDEQTETTPADSTDQEEIRSDIQLR